MTNIQCGFGVRGVDVSISSLLLSPISLPSLILSLSVSLSPSPPSSPTLHLPFINYSSPSSPPLSPPLSPTPLPSPHLLSNSSPPLHQLLFTLLSPQLLSHLLSLLLSIQLFTSSHRVSTSNTKTYTRWAVFQRLRNGSTEISFQFLLSSLEYLYCRFGWVCDLIKKLVLRAKNIF